MALPLPTPASTGDRPTAQPATIIDRPPAGGWYWNNCRLARAWLPLIGLDGLGLLDFYLALADHRPGASWPGWAAITLSELTRLTGWGRARLVRLNRLLVTAGLLTVQQAPVAGRGPAVQRSLYRPSRTSLVPDATVLARLGQLAEGDPNLAARLKRYQAVPPIGVARSDYVRTQTADAAEWAAIVTAETCDVLHSAAVGASAQTTDWSSLAGEEPAGAGLATTEWRSTTRPGQPKAPTVAAPIPAPATEQAAGSGAAIPVPEATRVATAAAAIPVPGTEWEPVPVPGGNRSIEILQKGETTTTNAPAHARDWVLGDEQRTLDCWKAANDRPASQLERQRLAQLAAWVELDAQATGSSGWRWVGEAIEEAVEAGSAYVAPRRIARILEGWQWAAGTRPTGGKTPTGAARRRLPPPSGAPSTPTERPAPSNPMLQQRATTGTTAGAGWTGRHRTTDTPVRQGSRPAGPSKPVQRAEPGQTRWPETSQVQRTGTGQARRPPPGSERPAALALALLAEHAAPVQLTPPTLPAAPAAVLGAALAAGGLSGETFLQGARLAGQAEDGTLLVATRMPLPPATAGRLAGRLGVALSRLLARPTTCRLVGAAVAHHQPG